ncbi:Urm1-domain-containing protein [Xylaria palmicola]|nr:Urm1-domain-containing protein [Xylaria palmicola]
MAAAMTTTAETKIADNAPKIAETPALSIVVEFTGGLEMLFSDQRRHALSIPAIDKNNKPVTIAYLVDYLCEHTMEDTRKELFVLDDHVRPGILVLINDADWELEGEEAYEIQNGDNILFVSTLHGG